MRPRARRGTLLSGAVSALVTRALYAVAQLAYLAIMARLLAPEDFGILALATSVTALAAILTETGFPTVLIQTQRLGSHAASAIFWVSAALSGLLAAAVIGLRDPVAALFGEAALAGALTVLALTLPVTALAALYRAVLSRRRLWGVVYPGFLVCQIAALGLGLLYAVLVAADYRALLVAPVVQAALSLVLFWWMAGWMPRRAPRLAAAWGLLLKGGTFSAAGISAFLNRQSDNLLIGWRHSVADLGFYSRGYSLFLLPTSFLVAPLGPVVLSALRRHADDAPARVATLGRTGAPLLLATALLSAFVFGFAGALVALVYGPGWEPVGPILALLGLSIYPATLGQILYWAIMSQGRAGTFLIFSLVTGLLRFAAFFVAVQHSVLAVALAWLVTSWLFTCALVIVVDRAGILALAASRTIALPSLGVFAAGLAVAGALTAWSGGPGADHAGLAAFLALLGLLALGAAGAIVDPRMRQTMRSLWARFAAAGPGGGAQ